MPFIFMKNIHCVAKVYVVWPMFQRMGLWEEGKPLPLAFQYLIFLVQRPCDLNLVIISSLASKCQDLKVGMPFFSAILSNEIEDL